MKKKLFLTAPLSLILAFSLAACSTSESASETSQQSESASESELESEETKASETSSQTSGSADISDAIDGSTTSDESAAPLGQWVVVTNYATADSTYHTVYVRATKVTTYSEDEAYIQEAIDLNNENSYDWGQIDLSSEAYQTPDDVEWCVLDYEVYIPENFPAAFDDGGIVSPEQSFSVDNIGGGGIPSNDGMTTYIGLTTTLDLESYASDATFTVGNTYTFKMLYRMVIGYQDYVFRLSSYPEGTSDYSSGYYAYFATQ